MIVTTKVQKLSGNEVIAAVVVSSAVVASLWILSSSVGAVGIARADDWSYLLTQFEFAESGLFVMNNWAVTMLIGQTLLAAPIVVIFGNSIAALQGFVAVLSTAALVATYVVVRRILSIGWSIFSLSTLAFSPIFGPSVVSFMTDIPALFFMSLSLIFGIQAVLQERHQWLLLSISGALALIAFSFRDYALVAFPAVVVVGLFVLRTRRERSRLLALMILVVLIAGALYLWRHSLPNDLRLPGWDLGYSIQLVARGTLTIALLISPALAAIAWWRIGTGNLALTIALYVTAFFLSIVILVIAGFELLGNVVHPFGSTWLVAGGGIRIWPLWVNRIIVVASVVSLSLLLALVGRYVINARRQRLPMGAIRDWVRDDPGRATLLFFPLLLLAAHSGATAILGTWYIDRYFILIVPFLVAALLRIARDTELNVSGRLVLVPVSYLMVFSLWGLHVVDFNARFDGARWQLGSELVGQGYKAFEVDAGMQWVSFHAPEIGQTLQVASIRPGRNWWTERYPDQRTCLTVSAHEGVTDRGEALATRKVDTLFGRTYTLAATLGPDTCE